MAEVRKNVGEVRLGGLSVLFSVRITSVCVLPNLCPVPLLFHRPLSQLQPVPIYFALVATFFKFCNVLICNNTVPNT